MYFSQGVYAFKTQNEIINNVYIFFGLRLHGWTRGICASVQDLCPVIPAEVNFKKKKKIEMYFYV